MISLQAVGGYIFIHVRLSVR